MTEREILGRKIARMKEAEIAEVLEYIAVMEMLRGESHNPQLFRDADKGFVNGGAGRGGKTRRRAPVNARA